MLIPCFSSLSQLKDSFLQNQRIDILEKKIAWEENLNNDLQEELRDAGIKLDESASQEITNAV